MKTCFMLNSTEDGFNMLINVKMPTIVDILTNISIINTRSESLKVQKIYIYHHFSFSDQFKLNTKVV